MKVRYMKPMAGPGVVIRAGQEADVSDEQAERLIAAGLAEKVSAGSTAKRKAGKRPARQKATDEAPERAVEVE